MFRPCRRAPTTPTARERAPDRFGLLDTTLQTLLLTPPPDFVAARKAAADELRRTGRRDEATAVAGLRRPAWTDWALNRAVVAGSDLADRFADAADAMRSAHDAALAGGEADVAGAVRALRDAAAALTRAAASELRDAGRPSDVAGLTGRLTAVAADPASTAALRSGILVDRGTVNDSAARAPATGRDGRHEERDRATTDREDHVERLERRLAELDERAEGIERDRRAAQAAEADALSLLERARAELSAAEARTGEARTQRADAERALAEHERLRQQCRRELLALEPHGDAPPEPPEQANGSRRRRA